jgi:hypothetical protein
MMWCNNPACDFSFDDSKEKTPMSCPKCKQSFRGFSRPKGWDPIKYAYLGSIAFPGGCLTLYQRYWVL